MHHLCNTSIVCVRFVRYVAAAQAEGRESEAALTLRAQTVRLGGNARSPRAGGRATRLHADAGRGGARDKSNDLQPAGAAAHRDDRHALGSATRPGRRARAVREGAASARSRGRAPTAPPGRPPVVPDELVLHIQAEHAKGKSLRQIARDLNATQTPTAHGGARWLPSTVRAILRRPQGDGRG